MTNGIFDSLTECQQAIAKFKADFPSMQVPKDWSYQEAIFLSGGTPGASTPVPPIQTGPVSIYEYMKNTTPYSKELCDCIESTYDHLVNPSTPGEDTSIPGLLLGRIQSGKTRAFIGVMSLAFDKGFDACIVLTKPDDGLVTQTKARLEKEFDHFSDDTNPCVQNVISIYDVNKNTSLSSMQLQFKNIFVLHKNSRLDIMKCILNKSFANKKVLIIDDEADFVSRTFYSKKRQISAGVTGFRIDDLMNNPQIQCYYLQVTATPYSLLLQPNDVVDVVNGTMSCFRPRFTVLVPTHNNYIGGKQYFDDSKNPNSMYSKLFHPVSDECFDYLLKKNEDARITRHPENHRVYADLRQALASYYVASAIRQIQETKLQNQKVYKSSMLIHCAVEKDDHTHQQKLINKILMLWEDEVNQSHWHNFNALPGEFTTAYLDFVCSINLGISNSEIPSKTYIPSKNEICKKLNQIFNQTEYTVKCVNGDTSDDPNMYTKNGQLKLTNLLNLFIGGYKADRGITIENMIAFAYGRRPQNGGSANTILQHMRQYGNRTKEDMAVTRFHTTMALHQKLEDIYHTDEALRDIFKNNAVPETVCIDYDPSFGFRLCQPSQVRMSDMYGFESFGRIVATGGMQTKRGISTDVSSLEQEIRALEPKEKTPFKVDKNIAIGWIHRIREMFRYNDLSCGNAGIDWDENIMIAAIEKYCPNDNEIWCYYRLNLGASRILPSGGFSDAPETGHTDTTIAKATATDRPFLMLFGEKGDISNGWSGSPFFWPVLRLPVNAVTSVFCYGVKGSTRKNSAVQVTLKDGKVVSPGASIVDTMVDCIKIADPVKVEALNIKYRKNNLVYAAGRCPNNYKTIIPGKFFLRKGISAELAKDFLTDISNKLKLGWDIQII